MSRPKVYFKNKQSKNTSPVPPSMFESSPFMRLEGMMYSKAQGGIRDTRKKELGPRVSIWRPARSCSVYMPPLNSYMSKMRKKNFLITLKYLTFGILGANG